MLNIFYGRESIDKEKFIYSSIAEKKGRTLVIVPDQYTLEAEKQAFSLLRTEGMMNVEVLSFSRLGGRLIAARGGGGKTFIDKYGRHMLLFQILSQCEDRLQVFRGNLRKNSFIEMTNNFISEMKQYQVTSSDLRQLRSGLDEESLLSAKLADLQILFDEYQKRIEGKYTDSEDYIDLYMSKISGSELIAESRIWVYGFDSFAPKALAVLGNLMASAREMNVFLTCDRNCRDEELFLLTELVIKGLEHQAEIFSVEHRQIQVAEGCGFDREHKSEAVSHLEKELYAVARRPLKLTKKEEQSVTVVQAANMYSEAESAASYILHLLRDKGFRCRDIMVICNDQNVRGSIISRVFQEYGIPLFDDRKRSVLSSPAAAAVTSMLETVVYGMRTADLFKALKTGFLNLDYEEIEQLENYAVKYRIKGTMWERPFVKGALEYGDDGLDALNDIRERAVEPFLVLKQLCEAAGNTGTFVKDYYDFLIERLQMGEKLRSLMQKQQEQGFLDLAEETAQIWGQIMGLFDQIVELAGEEPFEGSVFEGLLTAGLSQLETGVLPPTSDEILMGTMQRTRSGRVKAVLVLGANEGLLPAGATDEGLFSFEELEYLAEEGKELCKVDRIRVMEERLAIYRNLCEPSDYLWISFSASDEEGRETRPSEIIDTLLRIFPDLTVEQDIISSGNMKELVGGRISTLRHLTAALQRGRRGEKIDGGWKAVIDWYRTHEPDSLAQISEGLAFTNTQNDISGELADLLYRRDINLPLVLSPSRLERFSRCPFSHFVAYGLRPEERRIFQVAGREIGDIYHSCLMEISRKLTEENTWDTVTEEECRSFVRETALKEAETYREGLFSFSNEERYKTKRIEDTCFHVCWVLIEQVRAGKIEESLYEVPFGRNCDIPPVEVSVEGQYIYIEGKIDRLDLLKGDRVKIIDYKTGKETFDVKEARRGYRLQLMLYLKAAQQNKKKPAGVFYFLIDDPRVDLTETEQENISEKISKEMRKSFRLDGIMVDDARVIDDIAGEFEGFSDILPLRMSKEGVKATSEGFLLSEEEFAELQADVDRQISMLCGRLSSGRIAIRPKKTDRTSPCVYCEYRSICRFDLNFPGCRYDLVK